MSLLCGVATVIITLCVSAAYPPDTLAEVFMGIVGIVVGVNIAIRSQSEEFWM